jgi:dihydroceramidase
MTYSIIEGGNEGFWIRTASIDWCEENYQLSEYIAEFWNSFSNLAFILLASAGAWRAYKNSLDVGFILGYLSIIVVGFGSYAFHATLIYEMQLLDELPMIFCAATLLYCSLLENGSFVKRYGRFLILSGLMFYSVASILFYLVLNKPYIHQIAFGILTAAFSLLMIPIVKESPAKVKNLVRLAVGSYAFAFFLWNIDNLHCDKLRSFRNDLSTMLADAFRAVLPVWDDYSSLYVGSLAGSVFQLHAWWHMLSAWAAYTGFSCLEFVYLQRLGKNVHMHMSFKIMPVPIVREYDFVELNSVHVLAQPEFPKKQA